MFNRLTHRLGFSITRHWIRSRPGSVLILVIALLVLLALIGTAYLSGTQTERYTSVQNTVNTQADLLVNGLVLNVESRITSGLFSNNGQTFRAAPTQEISTTGAPVASSGYNSWDSPQYDDFLADRIPLISPLYGFPAWNSISWPPFPDSATPANYSFDSPFLNTTQIPIAMYSLQNKANVIALPTYRTINGQSYPAMLYFLLPGKPLYFTGPNSPQTALYGGYFTSSTTAVGLFPAGFAPVNSVTIPPPATVLASPSAYPALVTIAASASGDGIADSGLFKVPVGPIDGITYYGAMRVMDNNSAINVSTAWTAVTDLPTATVTDATITGSSLPPNYGFFRSNIGLRELLNNTAEMDNLNAYRFNNVQPSSTTAVPSVYTRPVVDDIPNPTTPTNTPNVRADFSWFSAGDAIERQLSSRPGNPGYNPTSAELGPYFPATDNKFQYMGNAQTAALAYHFSLVNPNSSQSIIEQLLPSETYYKSTNVTYHSTPYSPTQVGNAAMTGTWFGDQFDYLNASAVNVLPQRALLTGSSSTSNGIASRFGNVNAGGVTWAGGGTYKFGDWVTSKLNGKSYVCMIPISPTITPAAISSLDPSLPLPASVTPPPFPRPYAQYWGLVPWQYQPVKASINTATFEQLYLNFCNVMTDQILTNGAVVGAVPQWLPPLIPSSTPNPSYYGEEQIPQFRSVIRDNRHYPIANHGILTTDTAPQNTGQPGSTTGTPAASPTFTGATGRVQLTPMQMMQLRAAIAAINTVSIRNINSDVSGLATTHMTRSRRIVLPDTNGLPAFDVEVFGNDIQPFIGQMYAKVAGGESFIAIQLVNPYVGADILINANWAFATIDRSMADATASLTLTKIGAGTTIGFKIPAATASIPGGATPGMVTLYDGPVPPTFKLPVTSKSYAIAGLAKAIGKELVILRPRRLDGTLSKTPVTTSGVDYYDETANTFDLVPVDQLDMTGADMVPSATSDLYYRRAGDPATSTLTTPVAGNFAWNFVWPGFYQPYNTYNVSTSAGSAPPQAPSPVNPATWPLASYAFNQAILATSTEPTMSPANPNFDLLCSGAPISNPPTISSATVPTYNTITLQLANTSWPGANPLGTGGTNTFPFGGFTRNADLLQIPYIGAYRISDYNLPLATGQPKFYEMNSVTMDASLANDSTLQPNSANASNYALLYPSKVLPSTANNTAALASYPRFTADTLSDPFVEQIGHFCPIGDTNPSGGGVGTSTSLLDFGTDATYPGSYWHYHWTKKLFDYFTVQAPHDDYFPNVDPDLDATNYGAPPKYPVATAPQAVKNGSGTANVGEDIVGVEGLININTASWKVLATLPFVKRNANSSLPPVTDNIQYSGGVATITSTPSGVDDNIDLAKAIVDYRTANGPFKNITDLYNVPAFRLENDALLTSNEPGTALGDFSPGGIGATTGGTPPLVGTDGARFDFEERFLLLNQISNLITTRSDTFTCYVDLQGWRNVGTGNPTLAVERRKAFIFDRNAYSPLYKNPIYYPVPGN